ncbi:hypothetical protein VTK73DRAFT_7578 [Phialemonium thermophilum]|uniref:Arrestin C-terminal-like domain-containing protein n=1 Tax=Phialemonium thermophilum TaxID=223376 RepID=A0ABR3WDW7_9PEZI
MLSFNPFTSVTGRNAFTLFEIRLDNDFIVFRGNEHESAGQLLKGTVVLCLPAPLKIDNVHLRLTGTLRLAWTDSRATPTGISNQKVDKSSTILIHRWQPFVGIGAPEPGGGTSTKGVTLAAGNYEWPFELLLPGDTCESVEGLHEAHITYKLKATVARGKLAYDLHAYKRLRIIRTLESSALEFLHAMSVENIWPNKIEYSITIPQKAVVFGTSIPLHARFTPLLKGLELGDISVKLVEVHEVVIQTQHGTSVRQHKKEKEVSHWTVPMSREEHWQDMIEDTGQEGWVMNTALDLPRKLGKCVQDVNVHGIKVRHKLKLVVALKNPDGHVSELRATLPVTIFISPNMPLDEEGNLVRQLPQGSTLEDSNSIAPPGYGEHLLDELYDEVDLPGLQTPAVHSGMSTPFYAHSRAGSAENLAAMLHSTAVPPAALSSRLQSMSLDSSLHHNPLIMRGSPSETGTPHQPSDALHPPTSQSAPLSRRTSNEHSSGSNTPEHVDFPDLTELSKVPSYHTAVRTPVRPLNITESSALPDYETAISAPASPVLTETPVVDSLSSIPEVPHEPRGSGSPPRRASPRTRRQTSLSVSLFHHNHGDPEERRRVQLMQARDRIS